MNADAWTQAARDIAKLHAEKPRPLNKMFGPNPTNEQKEKHAGMMREWNKKDREARRRWAAAKDAAMNNRKSHYYVAEAEMWTGNGEDEERVCIATHHRVFDDERSALDWISHMQKNGFICYGPTLERCEIGPTDEID